MSKFNELVNKLNEIFQIDKPDLDFGIYRILNARRDEINDYLNNRLKEKVEASLLLAENAEDQQNQVFSHLLTFFSRYYDNGDFISQRRYKGDTYAIPYSGEEVVLHWANKDQYYIKSGENFSNYTIALADGRKVHFRLVSADTAKDNRKDNEIERRFVLIDRMIQTEIDEETGEESETLINPIEMVNGELTIRFAYKPMPKGTKQDRLNETAFERLKSDPEITDNWSALLQRAPTEKNPARTQLEKYLSDYTGKNSADYFIHKQLGKFLRGELDFYIKNEVMNLDDIQDVGAFAQIESKLRLIQTLRTIAHDVIDFMAQLEDFQKKLWLKKKFVTETNYCITLDRVPESLYADIIANEQQINEWVKLFAIDEIKGDMATVGYSNPLSLEFLRANPFLVLDTAFFDDDFKATLLNAIDNLDEQCDGLLIHSENFQALNLLQERYREQVKCIYIDPPYNTDAAPIIYKNGYKVSTWNTLIADRLHVASDLMTPNGILCATIDDFQYKELNTIINEGFGSDSVLGTVVIRNNPSGRPIPTGFAIAHEYAIFASPNKGIKIAKMSRSDEQNKRYKEVDADGQFMWELLRKRGSNSRRDDARKSYFPFFVKAENIRLPEMEWCSNESLWKILEEPEKDEMVVYPIDESGVERNWRWGIETAKKSIQHLKAETKNGTITIYYKFRQPEGITATTNWIDAKYSATEHGTGLVKHFFKEYQPFSYPKSIYAVTDCLVVSGASEKSTSVLDYFAGSGTTGHAVINLNREDNGKRKYILVEMGAHFDSVTKPRIQKVIYSKDWKDGKPVSREGISQCFKYLRLESYEDTLNNLNLVRSQAHNDLFANAPEVKEDYLLHYMLNIESKGSLLSVDAFKKPFDYTLNIAVDSAGAYQSKKIDLVETFNYLLGVRVKHIDSQHKQGFVTVTGTLPTGETCLIIWRDTDKLDYEGISKLCDRLAINPADNEYDVVYLNGDHNIPTVLTQTNEEGGATRVLKLRSIESEFLQRMFSVEDV